MSATVFTGPILAGNVLQSDGTGNLAGLGGSSGLDNVGFASMAQFASITESTVAAASGIVIPANSIITDIYLNVTTGWTAATSLAIGTTLANSNELATGIPAASLVQGQYTVPVTSLIAAWNNVSATQDVQIYTKSTGGGTAGVALLIVFYIQAANSYPNGQYT